MPDVKIIDSATWASLPILSVSKGDDLFPQLGADTYRLMRSDVASATVAALAAAIDQGAPTVGDTLTLTTNAPAGASYQWHADGVGITGETAATLDTTGRADGEDITCEVTAGVQTVTTAAVTLTSLATAPAQFGAGNWSVVASDGQAIVILSALPSDGGSVITAIEYEVDGGTWTDSGRTTTGAFTIAGMTNGQAHAVALRAVNAVGAGPASATKNVTPEATGGYSIAETIPNIDVALVDNGNGTHNAVITGSDADYTAASPVVVQNSDLAAGRPILLATPPVTFSGSTFTAKPFLWIWPAGDAATVTQKWYTFDTNEVGTRLTYDRQGGQEAARITYVEEAANLAGASDANPAVAVAQAGVSYAEATVTFSGGSYLRRNGAIAPNAASFGMVLSFTHNTTAAAQVPVSFGPSANWSYVMVVGGGNIRFSWDNASGAPAYIDTGAMGRISNSPLYLSDNDKVFLGAYRSGNGNVELWVKVNDGAWNYWDDSISGDMDFTNGPLIVGSESRNPGNVPFNGTLHRLAMWCGTAVDFSDPTVRDAFISENGGSFDLVAPAAAASHLGAEATWEVYGDAADYLAGTAVLAGTETPGHFTVTGTGFADA